MRPPPAAVRLAALALVLAACAPVELPMGPAVEPPRQDDRFFWTADAMPLPYRAWLPAEGAPRAVVLALHGMNDYSFAFDAPARSWQRRGIAVYAYDQRGFGGTRNRGYWPGVPTLVADLKTVAALLRARHPGLPLYLVGESMGGAVVLAALDAPDPPAVDGVVLVAPAVWGRANLPLSYRVVEWLGARTIPWVELTGRGLDIVPTDNVAVLRAMGRDPKVIKYTRVDAVHGLLDLMSAAQTASGRVDVPALVLYGGRDDLIPETSLRTALQHMSADRRRVAYYPDGYHMLLRDREAAPVHDDVAAWIADPAAPLPSGAEAHAAAFLAADGEE